MEKQIHHQIEVVADMNDLRKLVSEYGKIGSNLNQIAKHFNSGGSQSRAIENEIHQCITDLFLLRKEVLKLAGGMIISATHLVEGREGLNVLILDDHIPAGAKLY